MKKLCVVDIYEAKGHISLNKFFLRGLKDKHHITMIGSREFTELYSDLDLFKINLLSFFSNSKFIFRVHSFCVMFMALLFGVRNKNSRLLILSYEEISFSFFSRLFGVVFDDVMCFEHATIPNKKSHILKKIAFNLISHKITHLVFEEYISKFLIFKFQKKTRVIPHPCLLVDANANLDEKDTNIVTVFCPSGDVSIDFHLAMAKFAEEKKKIFYYGKINSESIKTKFFSLKKYYSNYCDVFCSSDIILFPLVYDYRVSGVFYEALSKNKIVIMKDSMFSRCCFDKYGNDFVKIYKNEKELFSILSSIAVTKYNNLEFNPVDYNEKSLGALMVLFE